MLDTTVFNHIIRDEVAIATIPAKEQIFVTHIQLDEIRATKNDAKRHQLQCVFAEIPARRIPTESALWDVSQWDEAKFSNENGLFQKMLDSLNARNKSKGNNGRDALIAEAALLNGYWLVTDDSDLAETIMALGGTVMTLRNFLSSAKSF